MIVFQIYLLIGMLCGLCATCVMIYQDIFDGPDLKFGYNYKNSIMWIIVALISCPVLNLTFAYVIFQLRFKNQ